MSNFFTINTFPTSNFLDDDHWTYPNIFKMLNFFDKDWISENWRNRGANLHTHIITPLLCHCATLTLYIRTIHSVYTLHSTYVNCIPIIFFLSRWELLGMPCLCHTMYVFICFCILILLIVPAWKLDKRQAFVNPWPTLQLNVRICMGLFLHKTLFLALIN